MWEIAGRQDPLVLNDSSGFITVAFSPDGRLLAGGRPNGQVGIWDLPEGAGPKWVFALNWIPDALLRGVAFTADGRHIVCVPGNGAAYVLRVTERPLPPINSD